MMRPALLVLALMALCGCESRFLPPGPIRFVSGNVDRIIRFAAHKYSVSAGLVRAVVMAESAGYTGAVSSAGAKGLMQLMPGTAEQCGVDNIFDPFENVDCGTRYLRQQLKRYNGNLSLAVAAYNAGPGAVDKYHGIPPYAETRAYVARVLAIYR